MPDGNVALQSLHVLVVIDTRSKSGTGVPVHVAAVARDDARSFLAAVLECPKAVEGDARSLAARTEDAEDGALLAHLVVALLLDHALAGPPVSNPVLPTAYGCTVAAPMSTPWVSTLSWAFFYLPSGFGLAQERLPPLSLQLAVRLHAACDLLLSEVLILIREARIPESEQANSEQRGVYRTVLGHRCQRHTGRHLYI